MNYPSFFVFLFFFSPKIASTQTGLTVKTIDFPAHTIVVPIDFDIKWRMLILEAKDSFLLLTPDKNWKRIKGLPRNLNAIQPHLKSLVGEKKTLYKYPYYNLETLEIETMDYAKWNISHVERGAIIGGASGFLSSIPIWYFASWAHAIGCNGNCEQGSEPKFLSFVGGGTLIGGLIGTVVGLSASYQTTIRTKRKVSKASDEEWQKALREFSVLR